MAKTGEVRIREVTIVPPSSRGELLSVLRGAMAILLFAWLYVVSTAGESGDPRATAAKQLLPFQSVVESRGVVDQRAFRELRVALIEAQNVRSVEGRWPDVADLAGQGIDPFAPDPTRRGTRYQWRMEREGFSVRYIGLPEGTDAPAWLILIQEPDPALPPEPYQDDEEHARLLDGTQLHVSIWCHDGGRGAGTPAARSPQTSGWTQLFAMGRSSTH